MNIMLLIYYSGGGPRNLVQEGHILTKCEW